MSPKSNSGNSRKQKEKEMMRKRREQHGAAQLALAADVASAAEPSTAAGAGTSAAVAAADGAAAAAADLAIIAVNVPVPGTDEQLQVVAQDPSTLMTGALVRYEGAREGRSLTVDVKSPPRVQASRVEECCTPTQTAIAPSIQNDHSTPNSKRNQLEDQKDEVKVSEELVRPQGIPQSFGPTATPNQLAPTGPLFTPEQLARWNEIERQAPILMPTRPSLMMSLGMRVPGLGGGTDSQGQLDLQPPAMDQGLRELQEARQREVSWRNQAEQMFEQMSLQLRASQAENARLRGEMLLMMEQRGSSRYATPEEKPTGKLKEDGPGGQQDMKKERLLEEERPKEDGPVGRQEPKEASKAVNLKRKQVRQLRRTGQ